MLPAAGMKAQLRGDRGEPNSQRHVSDAPLNVRSTMLDLDDPSVRGAIERALAQACGADVSIAAWSRLSGGAIQQNLALDVNVKGGPHDGARRWVMRTDAPSSVALSRSRRDEFRLLRVAAQAGVVVPAALFQVDAGEGRPAWFVMERIEGVAAAHRITKDGALRDPAGLARELGANLARLHAIPPAHPQLGFLGVPTHTPTRDFLAYCLDYLGRWRVRFDEAYPALEWGLAWWREHAPSREPVVLLHGDYRTGNYLVHEGRLAATLDWEFARWGNPLEDIGWFFAPCWRFAGPARVAGGIAPADYFLAGYNAVAGTRYTETETRKWQALAQIRWAVIALQQAERFRTGGERTLELALTGRLLAGARVRSAADPRAMKASGDFPPADDLLDVARAALLDQIVPLLPPEAQYTVRMAANAIAIARREARTRSMPQSLADELRAFAGSASDDERVLACALADRIRAGAFDEPESRVRLHEALTQWTRARLAVSNPRALER